MRGASIAKFCCGAGAVVFLFALAPVWASGGREAPPERTRIKRAPPKLALGGVCNVCLIELGKAYPGKASIKSVYKGFAYLFPSEKLKRKFEANPAKYAIQAGGRCLPCVVDKGLRNKKGDPSIYAVFNKKIYIFASEASKKKFLAHPTRYTGEKEAPAKRAEEGSHQPPRRPYHPRREGS